MLAAVAGQLVESSLRNGEQVDLRRLERLRSATVADARQFEHAERKLVLAGMLMARVRADDSAAAFDLAELVQERSLNRLLTPAPATAFLALEAALAEAYISHGATLEAMLHAERLRQALAEYDSPRWHLRALGLSAAAFALDGDHRAAQRFLGRIEDLKLAQGWDPDQVEYMDAVAEISIAFNTLDGARILRLRSAARHLRDREPSARSLVDLIETIALATEDDAAGVIAHAAIVAHGADQPAGPAIVRKFAIGVEAIALIQRGTPAQAIVLLRDEEEPLHHFVCFESIRASAFILMGDYRAALQATDSCLHDRATHNRWMLPAALLRRAVANLRLGHTAKAVTAGIDALSFIDFVNPRLGLIMLPERDIVALGARMAIAQPTLIPRLRGLQRELQRLPRFITPEYPLPRLSQREHVIAFRLRSDLSYTQIADELHVSASTVKTQANAIAKKLGGRTREDAIDRLEESGFFSVYESVSAE